MRWVVRGGTGTTAQAVAIEVPGDKSISHRALMLASLASGISKVSNLATGGDIWSTASCLTELGIAVDISGTEAIISPGQLREPTGDLDAHNSGTTMRLLSGILAGQRFPTVITGDESLRRRPMERVAHPLRLMGADISTLDGMAPIRIAGSSSLSGITFRPDIPSAQVKSCVLLAGLFASGSTTVVEAMPTRDHTERMLEACGAKVRRDQQTVTVDGGSRLQSFRMTVPGDFSSAAFFFSLGAAGARVTVRHVGINPTRAAFLQILNDMGANPLVERERVEGCEPVADVTVSAAALSGIDVDPTRVPQLIDELPLVAFLGAVASGYTRVRGATELRLKESDRIAAVCGELRKFGANIRELPDGFVVSGGNRLIGTECVSHGDHRIAMMLALAGSVAEGQTIIEDVDCASISFPRFERSLMELGVDIAVA